MMAGELQPRRGAQGVRPAEAQLYAFAQFQQLAIGQRVPALDRPAGDLGLSQRLQQIAFAIAMNAGMLPRDVAQDRHVDLPPGRRLADHHFIPFADQVSAHAIDPQQEAGAA